MSAIARIKQVRTWLWGIRASTRLGALLQVGSRIGTSVLSLVWTRLLLQAMGPQVYGLYITYQAFTSLGGLGELGMGGAVGLRVGRGLANHEVAYLREFLATARSLFLGLALLVLVLMASASGFLPEVLGFKEAGTSGSMTALFLVGALAMALVFPSSYLNNLNYACGNIVWGVIPGFLLAQVVFATQVGLAWAGFPLWALVLPALMANGCTLWFNHWQIRLSHPDLSALLPLKWCGRLARELTGQSFWVYLAVLSNTVFTTTDRLIINAFFGAKAVSTYHLNYKIPEIALFLVAALFFASGPKLALWLGSIEVQQQARGAQELLRLNRFQAFFGILAATFYLCVNDVFMVLWLGEEMQTSLAIQVAFAATLTVTATADAAIQGVGRTGPQGIRFMGSMLGIAGLINLMLSIWAGWSGCLVGIALATVVAQIFLALTCLNFCARKLQLAFLPWAMRTVVLPLALVGGVGVVLWFNWDGMWKYAAALAVVVVTARVFNISATTILAEVRLLLHSLSGTRTG